MFFASIFGIHILLIFTVHNGILLMNTVCNLGVCLQAQEIAQFSSRFHTASDFAQESKISFFLLSVFFSLLSVHCFLELALGLVLFTRHWALPFGRNRTFKVIYTGLCSAPMKINLYFNWLSSATQNKRTTTTRRTGNFPWLLRANCPSLSIFTCYTLIMCTHTRTHSQTYLGTRIRHNNGQFPGKFHECAAGQSELSSLLTGSHTQEPKQVLAIKIIHPTLPLRPFLVCCPLARTIEL